MLFGFKSTLIDLLLKNGHFIDKATAITFINSGVVYCNNEPIIDPYAIINTKSKLEVLAQSTKYISVSGYRLEHALNIFGITLKNKVGLELFANLGGYSEAMVHNGCDFVYTLSNQALPKRAENNKKIEVIYDNIDNIANFIKIPMFSILHTQKASILEFLPKLQNLMLGNGDVIVKINPLNETNNPIFKKFGVAPISSHQQILNEIIDKINAFEGIAVQAICPMPYTKFTGNAEYYLHIMFGRNVSPVIIDQVTILSAIDVAKQQLN